MKTGGTRGLRSKRHQGTDERLRRIYATVAAIPPGRVASYGQIAGLAGMPRGARLVGRALAVCPAQLPWHRVLTAAGCVALPVGDPGRTEQVRRLQQEGVAVIGGRVSLRACRWEPSLDELLWGPESCPAADRSR
jgi:methylated-DNA-protein-cysteine methyltransferase related protein